MLVRIFCSCSLFAALILFAPLSTFAAPKKNAVQSSKPVPFQVSTKQTKAKPSSKSVKNVAKTTTKSTAKAEKPARDPGCQAFAVSEFTTGEILSEQNSSQALPPASMTKLMTTYVILQAIDSGQIKWDDTVTISARASHVGGSQVYLKEGEQFSVRELVQALLIQSANDSAIALAEYVAGSKEAFVEQMNSAAKGLGMTASEFHSPHGLPPEPDQKPDLVSARDFLVLSRALLTKYPQLTEFTGQYESDFRNGEFKMRNHNKLLQSFAGCDGLKTGFYNEAGFSVAATAKRNDVRVITVVMGCGNRKKRDEEAAQLLAEGLKKYRNVVVAKAGEVVDSKMPVVDGEKLSVPLKIEADVSALLRVDGGEHKSAEITKELDGCRDIHAPLQAGTVCGVVKFSRDGEVIAETPLVVGEDVDKASISTKILRIFKLA